MVDILAKIQTIIGGLALLMLLGVVVADVLCRELGRPLVWLQNIAGFAFIWVVFFGAALGIKNGTHYTIKIFPHPVPALRRLMDFAIVACQLIFILVIVYNGYEFTVMSVRRLVMPAGVPMAYATVAIPLTGIFMLAYVAESLVTRFTRRDGEGD
jgi:TRAP-type C4-dicarboxylate transport system permease small subunit